MRILEVLGHTELQKRVVVGRKQRTENTEYGTNAEANIEGIVVRDVGVGHRRAKTARVGCLRVVIGVAIRCDKVKVERW